MRAQQPEKNVGKWNDDSEDEFESISDQYNKRRRNLLKPNVKKVET